MSWTSRTRASQVTHYFFERCRYYTPLLQRGWRIHWRLPSWITYQLQRKRDVTY